MSDLSMESCGPNKQAIVTYWAKSGRQIRKDYFGRMWQYWSVANHFLESEELKMCRYAMMKDELLISKEVIITDGVIKHDGFRINGL